MDSLLNKVLLPREPRSFFEASSIRSKPARRWRYSPIQPFTAPLRSRYDWEMELLRRRSRQLLHGAKVGVAAALIAEKYAEWEAEVRSLGIPGLS